MKKIVSLTLALVLIIGTLCVFPVGASAIEESNPDPFLSSGDWKYLLDENGNAIINGYVGSQSDLTVPDDIDGHKVTGITYMGIPGKSINYSSSVEIIRIGKNINKISPQPLYNLKKYIVSTENKKYTAKNGILYNKNVTKLIAYPRNHASKEFKIAKTVTSMGEDSVCRNRNLTKIVIPSNIVKVTAGTFARCNVKTVVISKNVKTIGTVAFWMCKKLNKLIFKTTKAINVGSDAFANCNSLKEVSLPQVKKASGDSMFEECKNLKKVTIPKKTSIIPGNCFIDCAKLNNIKIPATVKTIGNKAVGYVYSDAKEKYVVNKNFAIKGKKGSAAYKYAKKNGIKFKEI